MQPLTASPRLHSGLSPGPLLRPRLRPTPEGSGRQYLPRRSSPDGGGSRPPAARGERGRRLTGPPRSRQSDSRRGPRLLWTVTAPFRAMSVLEKVPNGKRADPLRTTRRSGSKVRLPRCQDNMDVVLHSFRCRRTTNPLDPEVSVRLSLMANPRLGNIRGKGGHEASIEGSGCRTGAHGHQP